MPAAPDSVTIGDIVTPEEVPNMATVVEAIPTDVERRSVLISAIGLVLPAELAAPASPVGAVVYAHAGRSDLDPRTLEITNRLNQDGLATLAVDLLTEEEALEHDNIFDLGLLVPRLEAVTRWLRGQDAGNLPLGYLGVGTGASTALAAAADSGLAVRAIVSLGGWLDLVGPRLAQVQAATLLVVGGVDAHVLELNRAALRRFGPCEHELVVVRGATHNFEQYGALDEVDELAVTWFTRQLSGPTS
jgi:putative phosphoribosyl transferase